MEYNQEITLFQDLNELDSSVTYMSHLKCYVGLDSGCIHKLEGHAKKIHDITNKASFDIGAELCEARNEYRHDEEGFRGWVEERLKFTYRTAYRMINRYKRFGDVENIEQLDIVLTAQYALSAPESPREATKEAIELAGSGEKITVAKSNEIIKKWQRIAKEREEEAEQAKLEAKLSKSHSTLAQQKVDELETQITDLQDKLQKAITPEKIEVIPEAILDKIKDLEALIEKQNAQKKIMAKEIEDLAKELRDQRDANEARRKQEKYVLEIKDKWKKSTDALFKALSQFIQQIPSPIATQSFEGDEWARYDHLEEALQQFDITFRKIKANRYSDQFVESAFNQMPVVVEG